MVEIVKVLAVGVSVVRLNDRQCAVLRKLGAEGLQGRRKLVLGHVLKQVARECKIDCSILQEIQVGDTPYLVFDAHPEIRYETVPSINRNAAARDHRIDEVAIPGTHVEDAIVRADHRAKRILPKALPQNIPPAVHDKTRFMIIHWHYLSTAFQLQTMPSIIRNPTQSARLLLTFPPLLMPMRG